MSERFIMRSVTGYTINPSTGRASNAHPPKRSFVVLDSAINYRIVAEFLTGSLTGREKTNERRSRELCEQLNAWDDEVSR
jgi:hypothetical protein